MLSIRKPWERFEPVARPILEAYIQEHGGSPGSKRCRRLGHGWIVSAVNRHYGGWTKMLRKMKLPPAIRQPGHIPGYRPPGYWFNDDNVRRELRQAFPDLLAWDTMPTTKMIQSRLAGICARAAKIHGLSKLARRLGLRPYLAGMRRQYRVEDICWVIDFYEQYRRWPRLRECNWRIRQQRFVRDTSWHDFCRPADLPHIGVLTLIARFEQHREWLKLNYPAKVLVRQRVLNFHTINLQRRFPPLS